MNRQRAKYLLLTLAAVAIFAVLLQYSQRVNEDLNSQYQSDLRQLEGLHALLNENILRVKLGLLTQYDSLGNDLSVIDRVRADLAKVPAYVGSQGRDDLSSALAKYDEVLNQQKDLVEQFKTKHAVLSNSLTYFTIVVSDLAGRGTAIDLDPAVTAALNSLLQDILLFNSTADPSLVTHIQDHISALKQYHDKLNANTNPNHVDFDILSSHTDIILLQKPAMDALIGLISQLPLTARIADVSALYNTYYETARRTANLAQIGLYGWSLVVIAFVAFSIVARFRKSAELVSKAKEELQVTYASLETRSGELEVANSGLQRAMREVSESNRLKSEFLSTMSHELRTPLNAIIGYTGILLMGMDGEIDASAREMIENVDSNSKRLLQHINDILDISKIEAGRMDVVVAPVALREMVTQWNMQLGSLLEQKGLTYTFEVDSDLPEKVNLDRERVTQVVTNLLSNAVKFTERGQIRLSLFKRNSRLVIEVADTGIGIPPHALDFIFDEFRQVDGSSRRAYGGTGLGLAIVRNLCRLMGGNVTVQSAVNRGSTFTVLLPLTPAGDSLPQAVPAVPAQVA